MTIACRLSAECPRCGEALLVRHRRADNQPFLSCSGYPGCTFACNYDQALAEALQPLRDENAALRQKLSEQARPGIAGLLKQLLFACHPDRWHGNPCAEELTKVILDFRKNILS